MSTTAWFMVGVTAVLIGIDVWLAVSGGETYSERLRLWGKQWPPTALLAALSLGVLLGHWFW